MRAFANLNLLWKMLQTSTIRKDQKVAKRNLTVYLPLFMSYIDNYCICLTALLLLLISMRCHLA